MELPYPLDSFFSFKGGTFTGSIKSIDDLTPSEPFTVTWTVEDNGKTCTATANISGCVKPTLVSQTSSCEGSRTYTVTPAPLENGVMKCGGEDTPTTVTEGSSVECEAFADEGYIFDDGSWSYTGGTADYSCPTGNKCTFSNIKGNITVSAKLKTGGGGGTKQPNLTVSIAGGEFTFKAMKQSSSATITNASTDTAATNVTWQAKKGGTVLDSGTIASLGAGASQSITIKADEASLEGATVCVSATAAEGDTNPADNEACGPVKVQAAPAPVSGTASPVPTMSEIGLLLSGIALAGAAAPALRRRERKGRKQD